MIRLMVPGGAGGVQGAEHQVARLRGPDRRLHGLEVAHLADEDHVRVLTQHAAQGLGEARHVDADLALVHDRLLVVVVVLDRVLDRDDVAVEVRVDVVDHRRERGRLARAGRARSRGTARGAAGTVPGRSSGRPICSKVSRRLGIRRSTIARCPFCRKTETRKRACVAVARSRSPCRPSPAVPAGSAPA